MVSKTRHAESQGAYAQLGAVQPVTSLRHHSEMGAQLRVGTETDNMGRRDAPLFPCDIHPR